ncbi:hypothetical protein MELB17_05854 [Marinobacter sp. ELB17]|nr:hypothetical protein MELB17_05854 [Marinobacter sp. ELB17]
MKTLSQDSRSPWITFLAHLFLVLVTAEFRPKMPLVDLNQELVVRVPGIRSCPPRLLPDGQALPFFD